MKSRRHAFMRLPRFLPRLHQNRVGRLLEPVAGGEEDGPAVGLDHTVVVQRGLTPLVGAPDGEDDRKDHGDGHQGEREIGGETVPLADPGGHHCEGGHHRGLFGDDEEDPFDPLQHESPEELIVAIEPVRPSYPVRHHRTTGSRCSESMGLAG